MSQKTYMYDTQWQALLNAIQGGDPTAIVTALGQIKTSIDAIETALGSLSADVTQDSTQWTALVNAITNQQISVNLNNINTDNTYNRSNFSNQYLTAVLNQIYNTLFTLDTNIVKWTKITTFTQFDVYLFKIGIIKILWIDTAKNNIPSGWQSGGVGILPVGYEGILNPQINENKTLRNGVQMTINVSSNGMLNVNPQNSIASGTQIRCVFIYI